MLGYGLGPYAAGPDPGTQAPAPPGQITSSDLVVDIGASATLLAPVLLTSSDLVVDIGMSATLIVFVRSSDLLVDIGVSATLRSTDLLRSWDLDESQKFVVDIRLSGILQHFPVAVAPPLGQVNVWRESRIYPDPVLDGFGQPINWSPVSSVSSDFGRVQIVLDGQDVTFLRNVPSAVIDWASAEPFGDSTATLDFAQISEYEQLEVGGLSAFRAGRFVDILLIRPDGSTKVLWAGLLATPRGNTQEAGGALALECQGALFQADWGLKAPSFDLSARDIGVVIAQTFNDFISRDYGACTPVITGILTRSRGGWTPRASGYVQDLLSTATTGDGGQWTVAQSGRTPVVRLKDRATVHATFVIGQPGVTTDLASDLLAGANVYFGEGTDPNGCHWRNSKYPNLRPDDAPVYPLAANQVFTAGSGTGGFGPFADEMRRGGYTMFSGNTYVSADVPEVRDAQARAGIQVDGIVGPQTWAAVFQTGSDGGDLSGAYFAPLIADPLVEPRLYNANGGDIGANPAFDPSVPRIERYINYGEGITRHEATISARGEYDRDRIPGWHGAVTFSADPEQMSRFELRAGMNLLARRHRGANRMLHVAQVDVDWRGGTVACAVDERARDLASLAAIESRNRDARVDPGRRQSGPRRASRLIQDVTSVFDCEAGSGVVPRHALFGGLWTVLRIPAGQSGTIARTEYQTDAPIAPFALGVFGQPVTANQLRSLVGNPLGQDRPWNISAQVLLDLGILEAWGSRDDRAGYSPGSEPEGDPLTGRLYDGSAWTYESAHPPYLWVAEFSETSCFISGRFSEGVDR